MRFNLFRLLIAALLLSAGIKTELFAQNKEKNTNGVITGKVLDQTNQTPIEFATVVIIKRSDSTQVTGTTTDTKGQFVIGGVPEGTYFARISYVGYKNHFVKSFQKQNGKRVDLGKILLIPSDTKMNDIVISGTRSPITYQSDKKVINVTENFSAISGTAVDVLENVPSVTVDIDGNVSLRGSGNFQVLIDGRPSLLDPNVVLQQTQASSIENIEIITNPSAKYDPEGTAGIINIVLKKNNQWGISGLVSLNVGANDKYGSDANVDFRNNDFQSNLGIGYNNWSSKGNNVENNWNKTNGETYYYSSTGDSKGKREFFNIRGSVSYDFGNKKILTLGGRYNNRSMDNNSTLDYQEWNTIDPTQKLYLSKTNGDRSGNEYTVFSNYKHTFNNNGHELYGEIYYNAETSNEGTTTKLFNQTVTVNGKKTTESGPSKEINSKIDYTLPLSSISKFEAGYQGQIEWEDEFSSLASLNTLNQEFVTNPLYENSFNYKKNEIAMYSIFSSKIDSLDYKIGFRTEYTGRDIEEKTKGQKFSIDRWDYFPSAHFSYQLGMGNQIMTSYTRRINRPHGWELEPLETWIDAYNVRKGNPSLLPEFIDSYELGYQTIFGNALFSIDAYYRITKNKIERVLSVHSENVSLQTTKNIGKDYSLGTEFYSNFDPTKGWNINLMGNLYNYKIEGSAADDIDTRESFNWSARFNNNIEVAENTQLQCNFMYNSPSVSSQGHRKGFVAANLAVKQQFFDKLITATLQIRDVLRTAKFEMTNESADFYNYRHGEPESPMIMLNLKLNLNKTNNNIKNNLDDDRNNSMDNNTDYEG
jgi:outer membrane receptor protein involved in Fe transport